MLHRILSSFAISYHGKFTSPSSVGTWLARNECIFDNQSCSQHQIIQKVVQCATKFFFLVYPTKKMKIGIPRIIKWNSLLEPLIKLNTNGSSLGNPGLAGAGGLLRNSSGAWISSFSLHMGITSNNIAELGAVRLLGNPELAGAGGLLRNSSGAWI